MLKLESKLEVANKKIKKNHQLYSPNASNVKMEVKIFDGTKIKLIKTTSSNKWM